MASIKSSSQMPSQKNSWSSLLQCLAFGMVSMCCFQMIVFTGSDQLQLDWSSCFDGTFRDFGAPSKKIDAQKSALSSVRPVVMDPMYLREQDRIDNKISAKDRCAAFGLEPTSLPPRRIFFGSLLADESWQALQVHSTEVYNVYHAIALVESNTTHTATPRKMRYRGNTEREQILRYGHMFGNETKVMIGYWLEDMPKLLEMNREYEQMNVVVDMWKEAGMTEDDIGVIADLDEVVSRDFLRALQVCDFPQFQPGQNCQRPKLCLGALQFEGSPLCIKKQLWFHPDVISGQCIDGIGDPSERVTPLREYKRRYGIRTQEYGAYDPNKYPQHVLDSERFPLWTARDVRNVEGSASGLSNYKDKPGHEDTAAFGVAFHLHNWFDDFHVLRHKYRTYTHPTPGAAYDKLSQLEGDVDVMVRCARNLGNKINPTGRPYYFSKEEGTVPKTLGGPRPIYFLNKTYVNERHSALQRIVEEDEKQYGTVYVDGMKKES